MTEEHYVGNLALNGVFLSDNEKIALINNQPYHLGDIVDGMKIITIDFTRVRLQKDSQVYIIRVAV